jgi:diketogulonate reductase-like aldo/keto reductase
VKTIADRHRASIANVGVRYALDRPAGAGVIVGARLGVTEHLVHNARVFSFALDDADRASIETVLGNRTTCLNLSVTAATSTADLQSGKRGHMAQMK